MNIEIVDASEKSWECHACGKHTKCKWIRLRNLCQHTVSLCPKCYKELMQKMSQETIVKEIFKLREEDPEKRTDWECQCPPERIGAEVALLHMLGFSWEKAKEVALASPYDFMLEEILEKRGIEVRK